MKRTVRSLSAALSATLFVTLAALLAPAGSAHAARTVLILGDSLSAGYGIAREAAWPQLLAERLRAHKPDYIVVNASISGDTTSGGRARIGTALAQHRPAVLVVELGANDGLRGLPVVAMRANLAAIIDEAGKAGARVLLVGMELPPNYGPDYSREFAASYARLAREKKVGLVPFLLDGFAMRRELFQADGLHPTEQAQPLMLETVWKGLAPLLR